MRELNRLKPMKELAAELCLFNLNNLAEPNCFLERKRERERERESNTLYYITSRTPGNSIFRGIGVLSIELNETHLCLMHY